MRKVRIRSSVVFPRRGVKPSRKGMKSVKEKIARERKARETVTEAKAP